MSQDGIDTTPESQTVDRGERLAYSVDGAATMIGISKRKCYELISSGQLVSVKLGRRRLIRHGDLVAFVNGLGKGAAA